MHAPSLADALAALGRDWSAATRIPVTFELAPPDLDVPDELANDLLLMVREALRNVAAHAQARQVTLTLSYQDGQLGVEVGDDGLGFVAGRIDASRTGLAEMRDRARFYGGDLAVDSEPGNGTLIAVVVPLVRPAVIEPPSKPRGPWLIAGAVAGTVTVIVAGILLLQPSSGLPLMADPGNSSGTPSVAEAPLASGEPATPSAEATQSAASPGPSTVKASNVSAVCKVSYVKRSEWATGFTAEVTITNLAPAQVMGWRLVWAFGGNQNVTNAWNTRLSQQGTTVTAEDASHNQKIKSDESVTFGFQASFTGGNANPGSFTLNGNRCLLA